MAAAAEKAQQEPQLPWSLTAVTAPWARQSTLAGSVAGSKFRGILILLAHGELTALGSLLSSSVGSHRYLKHQIDQIYNTLFVRRIFKGSSLDMVVLN